MTLIRKGKSVLVTALVAGSCLFQSCPLTNILGDCFEGDSISESEFDDLNVFEQLLYDENDCGRFEMRININI